MKGFSFLLLLTSGSLQAGGPWLVYTAGSKTAGGYVLLNLGYDSGPQYASKESDSDEDTSLVYAYNRNSKKIEISKVTYDGDNTGPSLKNAWHRSSWGRSGNTFIVLTSQYEVVEANGVCDHGVGFATGTCVQWPNKRGDIGVDGKYPLKLNAQLYRLDGYWEGSALGTGSRQVKQNKGVLTLDVRLTTEVNKQKALLASNADAKDWIINYLVSPLS